MIIVVTGLGRCGSSVTMQMLNAAGIACTGVYPSFEDHHANIDTQDSEWLTKQEGKATKILLPNLFRFKSAKYLFIWVDRDPLQQACSTAKFMHLMVQNQTSVKDVGNTIVKMTRSYKKDRNKCIKHIKTFGPVLNLHFEDIIKFPKKSAMLITDFLSLDLDHNKMANVVIPRSVEAKKDMNIELQLIKNHLKEGD